MSTSVARGQLGLDRADMAADNNAVSSTNWTDFSLVDLYAALEAERSARGITWRRAMQEIIRSSGSTRSVCLRALDAARLERGRTWVQVAQEIGTVSPASLTHLQKGGRTAFPHVMRMVRWLDRPAADFVRTSAI